jgi:hypothetical protein
MQAGCGHLDETCLDTDVMTPVAFGGLFHVSSVTVGWAEDLGYQVNYANADAGYTLKQANCCPQRRLGLHDGIFPSRTLQDQQKNDEARNIAIQFGKQILSEQHPLAKSLVVGSSISELSVFYECGPDTVCFVDVSL